MTNLRVLGAFALTSLVTLSSAAQTPTPVAAAGPPPARTVTLPLTEYNRLLDLASRPAPVVPTPPLGAVLARADLRVRVERDTARGVYTLSGETLRDGVHRVELLTGSTLVNGTAAGRPLPLVVEGNTPAALVQGVGPFSLTLDWVAPLAFRPGRASFSLPVPLSGTARATLDLPGEQADVHLSRGVVTRRSAANGRTLVEATLQPGDATDVWWSMRDSAPVAAARDVRTVADVLSLITLGDSDVRLAALVDVTVVQGEPKTIDLRIPAGYEVTSITGPSLDSTSDARDRSMVLTVTDPGLRRHQFLVALERSHHSGSFSLETTLPTVPGSQRERGEIAIEGVGTLELEATEHDGTHRIDVRELNPALSLLARSPLLAAFRYQRTPTVVAGLSLVAKRFADAGVLAAVADRGTATTMMTSEGRALTEIVLTVRNRAQPFLKLTLPTGATLASVEVAGQPAKPVLGTDGTRIPLLRPGFRSDGPYQVSFVYVHGGAPLTKRGHVQMLLPKMDLPIGIVHWEVFVPETYSARVVDGNVIDWHRQAGATHGAGIWPATAPVAVPSAIAASGVSGGGGGSTVELGAGGMAQLIGRVTDTTGAVLPGVTVEVQAPGFVRRAISGGDGWYAFAGLPSGAVSVTAFLTGFSTRQSAISVGAEPQRLDFALNVGAVQDTITVTGATPRVDTMSTQKMIVLQAERLAPVPSAPKPIEPPSQNVFNLQRRAAGVLPIRVDVPRTGVSHRFVKPLVVDQDTMVTLRYKRRSVGVR